MTEIALDKGQKAALAAGQKLLAATKKGTPLAAPVAAAVETEAVAVETTDAL